MNQHLVDVQARMHFTHLSSYLNVHPSVVHRCSCVFCCSLECNHLHLLFLDDEVPQLYCYGIFQYAAD